MPESPKVNQLLSLSRVLERNNGTEYSTLSEPQELLCVRLLAKGVQGI